MVTTDELLQALGSADWTTRAEAARQLQAVPGECVTRALVRAMDSDDTAVTQAAVESLLKRADPVTADLIWELLPRLDDDLADHVRLFLSQHPHDPITRELERRDAQQRG